MSGSLILRIALGILVPACALLVAVSVLSARTTPPARSSEVAVVAPTASVQAVVAVVAVRGSAALGSGWGSRLGTALHAQVVTYAASDSAALGSTLERVTADADVVVVVGDGLLAGNDAIGVVAAGIGTVHVQSRYADVAIIGPSTGASAAERTVLASVTKENDASWIDPVANGWGSGLTTAQAATVLEPLLPSTSSR